MQQHYSQNSRAEAKASGGEEWGGVGEGRDAVQCSSGCGEAKLASVSIRLCCNGLRAGCGREKQSRREKKRREDQTGALCLCAIANDSCGAVQSIGQSGRHAGNVIDDEADADADDEASGQVTHET